jgi:hypothetical protein
MRSWSRLVGVERAVEQGFELEGGAHAAKGEVAEPQVFMGQAGVSAGPVEYLVRFSHHGSDRSFDGLGEEPVGEGDVDPTRLDA